MAPSIHGERGGGGERGGDGGEDVGGGRRCEIGGGGGAWAEPWCLWTPSISTYRVVEIIQFTKNHLGLDALCEYKVNNECVFINMAGRLRERTW
jgi:hypothetical protein